MKRIIPWIGCLLLTSPIIAQESDNSLTPDEKQNGWELLFDGKDLSQWVTSNGSPIAPALQSDALNPHACKTYMIATKKKYKNYVLSLDLKLTENCNSGIFFRVFSLDPLPGKDVGWNGMEVAVQEGTGVGYHSMGAIYDLVHPIRNTLKPLGEWNQVELTIDDNLVLVTVNGKLVTWMDVDKFAKKNKRPDGSDHKFDVAYRDFPRIGHIGLQDHGHDCWYKNIKIKELPASE